LTLENVPLQPLYLALKNLSPNQVAEYLPRLSKNQRQLIQDIDLWYRDELEPDQFDFWIQSFAQVMDDDVRGEFSTGVSFLMYLKGRFNIWTFDHDDPQYPDHDNYFLTDDGLLLFEFHEDVAFIAEVRALIRELYAQMGVENAYTWLFKMVSEGVVSLIEDEYQQKIGRLNDAGFVDYYDALEIDNPFINRAIMENKLKKKEKISVGVSTFSKNQILPAKALTPFKESFNTLEEEIAKVEDEKRMAYLRFNFLRLVNSNVVLRGSFRDGAIAISRAGEKTRNSLLLGYDYLIHYALPQGIVTLPEDEGTLFDHFDFQELFRIGNSLIRFLQGDLKKALRQNKLEDAEAFLGRSLNEFIDHTLDVPPKACLDPEAKAESILDYQIFTRWDNRGRFIITFLPFVSKLYESFKPLKLEGLIQDHFYTNYKVDDIDVEAVLISSFANMLLVEKGLLKQEVVDQGKLGLTILEFKSFCQLCLNSEGLLKSDLVKQLSGFKKGFGFESLEGFDEYFLDLLRSQIVGYDYENLSEDDFAHVGGPIILKGVKDLS
ncbi:MAG: DUF6178 family protein, partial [Halobacteriovoraceae bacterium]|nr:DUF6178 family protein [Halobacteriovoraceae bacterium]